MSEPLHPENRLAEALSDVRGIAALLRMLSLEDCRSIVSAAELSSLLFVGADVLRAALDALEAWQTERNQLPLL
jgi:hypothetical protein